MNRLLRSLLAFSAIFSSGLAASEASAVECRDMSYENNRYTICEVDSAHESIQLFLNGPDGAPYGQFSAVDNALQQRGKRLAFATNAGMYHADRSPVGHYVEDGTEQMRVIANAGPGNFGLLPNGVFCVRDGRADVIETQAYLETRPNCRYATQSGPMLVIDGELHPRFLPDSTSRYIRNGVGTSADGTRTVFAISQNTVTFHEFGRLFRDALDLPSALYLDGNISRMFAPDIGRNDLGFRLGPIVGVVEPNG